MESETTSNEFSLTSPVFANKQPIPLLYTCKGENKRPPLAISKVPINAKSLAIVMRDPDAVNGEWTHWTIWNISPATTVINESDFLPGAIEGTTSFGKSGYGGPCPPAGTGVHHYNFDLYALDSLIDLPATSDKAQLEATIKPHIIEKTSLIGTVSGE